MRRSSIALGERTFDGSYNYIFSAGEVIIANSDINKLYMAGEANINNSKVKKLRIAGEIDSKESSFIDAKCIGEIRLSGLCKADSFTVTGDISAENLECRLLRENKIKNGDLKGDLNWTGYFKAETFENFHTLNLSFDYDFINIISSGLLISEKEVICENYYGFGGIRAPQINAENITLLLSTNINLEALVGTNISIIRSFRPDKLFKALPKTTKYTPFTVENNKIVSVPQIDGDKVFVEYTKSRLISGNDIFIGDLSIVDRVEYKNNIHISEKAVVNEVVKL